MKEVDEGKCKLNYRIVAAHVRRQYGSRITGDVDSAIMQRQCCVTGEAVGASHFFLVWTKAGKIEFVLSEKVDTARDGIGVKLIHLQSCSNKRGRVNRYLLGLVDTEETARRQCRAQDRKQRSKEKGVRRKLPHMHVAHR